MLARMLIISFVLEVVVGGLALAWWLDIGPGPGTLIALTAIVLGRLFIALLSFVPAYLFRSERPAGYRIDAARTAGLLARECVAVLRLFFALHPMAPWLDKRDPDPSDRAGMPVLLVHGFFSNRGFWWDIKRYLRGRGVTNLFTMDLEPLISDIDRLADRLERRIREVLVRADAEKLVLVAHSMGGVVARAYLRRFGGARVARLVTLGSPHAGTVLAWLLPGSNLRQMRPNNRWLRALNDAFSGGVPVPSVAVYSYHDNIIAPQENARLPGATNIPVPGLGHLEMAFSQRIKEMIRAQIAAGVESGARQPTRDA